MCFHEIGIMILLCQDVIELYQQRRWGLMVMSRWQRVYRFLPILILALVLTGCGDPYLSALDPKGPVAEEQLSLIVLSFIIMVLVSLVVFLIFTYVLVRFRQRPGQEDEIPKQVEGNHKLEITWTVIPILLLLLLAVPTVVSVFSQAEDFSEKEGTINVKVVSQQFWWEFQYQDLDIVTAQELYIPVGQWIQFDLTSKDVLHSFWVPSLAGKQDTNPGLINPLRFMADEPGVYQGRCAELCGPAHALMNFNVIAVEPAVFEEWVSSMQNFTDETTTDETTTGQSEIVDLGREVFASNCIGCHAIDSSQAGGMGPNLAGFANRKSIAGLLTKNDEELERWIRDPEKVKPGNKMPGFVLDQISEQDMSALIQYLNSLSLE